MLRALGALLARPAPGWAWGVAACGTLACFVLAAFSFSFPLSYCDSPSWAPAYLAKLLGIYEQGSFRGRGALVPAWFDLWGTLSIAWRLPNLIGWVQAAVLGASALAVLLHVRRGMTCIELLLVPAFVLSGLRHAVYSQTLLSEPVVVPLVIGVSLWLIRPGTPSLRGCAGAASLAAIAAAARVDNLLLVALVAVRSVTAGGPRPVRAQRLALVLVVAIGTSAALARLEPESRGEPIGRVMIVAEWARFTQPPRHALARLVHFDLVERLSHAQTDVPFRDIYDALRPVQRLFKGWDAPSGGEIARFVLYQLVNRPLAVVADRARVWADLHASGYAAFWPAYRAWSSFYSPYDQVFVRWRSEDLAAAAYSCDAFARAQARHHGVPPLRSGRAVAVLRVLHQAAGGYARFVLRPLSWLAVPVSLALVLRRRGGAPYAWLAALVFSSLALRAAAVCADERYQLPVDLLALVWLAFTLRHSLATSGVAAQARGAAEA